MRRNILFVGHGNMTRKYVNILKTYKKITIKYFTKQNIASNLYKNLKKLKEYNPDVIFICSSTVNHFRDLSFVNNLFQNKRIFVEKPLFHKLRNIKPNNEIYVNYNLRYDPLLQYLKKILKNKKVCSVEVFCKSYLPRWRKINYTKTYSSKKSMGGGVLLDLSHELDYVMWIFDQFNIKFVINNKISDLKINSDDNLLIIGNSKKVKQLIIHLNYYSKIESRYISISGDNFDLNADLINKKIYSVKKKKIQILKSWTRKGFAQTFEELIRDILFNKNLKLPNLESALNVQKVISKIQRLR